jgi:O-antigen/teichoic acid export membrane protein
MKASESSSETRHADDFVRVLWRKVASAGSWVFSAFLVSQLVRFAGTLVMSKLLFPEAFGKMALVQSVYLGVQLLSDMGINQAIIQNKSSNQALFLRVAFTMQCMRGLVLAVVLLILAHPAAQFYNAPEIQDYLSVMAFAATLLGLTSTKVALAHRRLTVKPIILLELGAQILGVLSMIFIAGIYNSPWALVLGNVITTFVSVLFGHLFLKGDRDSFALNRSIAKDLLHFGGWSTAATAVTFLGGEGRYLIGGKLISAADLGFLTQSTALAFIGWISIQQVVNRVLLPTYAMVLRTDETMFLSTLNRARWIQLSLGLLTCGLLVVTAPNIVAHLYDSRYAMVGSLIQLQCVGLSCALASNSYAGVLTVMGKLQGHTLMVTFQALLVLSAVTIGGGLFGVMGIVCAVAISNLIYMLVVFIVFHRLKLSNARIEFVGLIATVLLALYVWQFGTWPLFFKEAN